MKYVYPNLVKKMMELGVTDGEAAAIAGISERKFRLKMRGFCPWKLSEAVELCHFFNTTDVVDLFLQLDNN